MAGIEYPGPVHNVDRAIQAMGGLPAISSSLLSANTSNPQPLELQLAQSSKFFHPITASSIQGASVTLKLTKRKRKFPVLDAQGHIQEIGEFKLEPVGIMGTTMRFRNLADFQYLPQTEPEDPIIDLADAIQTMNIDKIAAFNFPLPSEITSSVDYIPPPVFSRSTVPQAYDFKPAAGSVATTIIKPSGDPVNRLVNIGRAKIGVMMAIPFNSPGVPTEASAEITASRVEKSESLESKLLVELEKRPVWTRTGLVNQLSPEDGRAVTNNKQVISAVAYTFSDGPFRELVIRFGYDPRVDPEARFYQRLSFRNLANARQKRPAALNIPEKKNKPKDAPNHLTHTFDGQMAHSKIGSFQLIDISDPLCYSLIHSTDGLLPSCESSESAEGWFSAPYFEQIKQVVRRKFIGLLNGSVVGDEECADLLGDPTEVKERGRKKKEVEEEIETSEESEDEDGNPKRKPRRRRAARETSNDDSDIESTPKTTMKKASQGRGKMTRRLSTRSNKNNQDDDNNEDSQSVEEEEVQQTSTAKKARGRGRGRPRKTRPSSD